MNKNHHRARSNLAMLNLVARKLGVLNDKVVYLGGCATALFINDPLSLDVRPTVDVDCIVDVICRWHYDEIILDVMPTDDKILGFGNRWYKEALEYAVTHQILGDLFIRSVAAPYFLATKVEAFRTRGNNDFLASHDFEDIITVIAGRINIVEEVASSTDILKVYLHSTFSNILRDSQFEQALPGHLSDGTITLQRVQTVIERINKIVLVTSEVR